MKLTAIVVIVAIGVIYGASVPPCQECTRPNEVYSECGTACPETCDNIGEVRPCILLCVQGCFCQEGYVRNNVTGECVQPCDCPPKSSTTSPLPTDTTCR